jgi:FKBP-type peptidyl-prolyl cis-trans isomerase FkpA
VESYLTSKGLLGAVTLHPKKFYYKINTAGSGLTPNSCSNVLVKYRGALTNDTVFTSPEELSTGAVFTLGQLIAGWQLGLGLLQKGGNITLYLPPSLAYGSSSTPSIPANSVLIFDISLVDVANY